MEPVTDLQVTLCCCFVFIEPTNRQTATIVLHFQRKLVIASFYRVILGDMTRT